MDGFKCLDCIEWQGYESQEHTAPFRKIKDVPLDQFNNRTSCTLNARVHSWKALAGDQFLRRGIHDLAYIRDHQDIFYSLVINYITFGTCLPWGPCKCSNPEDAPLKTAPKSFVEGRKWLDQLSSEAEANPFHV